MRQARKRTKFGVGTAAIAFLAAGLAGLGTTGAQAGTGSTAFSATIPAVPAVTTTLMDNVHQNPRLATRDNGASAQLDGKSYWIFADTILKNPFWMSSSSASVTNDLNADDGIDLLTGSAFSTTSTTVVDLVPHSATEKAFETAHNKSLTNCTSATDPYCGVTFAYWPGQVFADTVNHRIVFSYGKLCRGGANGTPCSGSMGKSIGTGYAAIDPVTKKVTRLAAVNRSSQVQSVEGTDPTLLFAQGESVYTGRNVIDGELYTNGGCNPTCNTAKVALDKITDYTAYRYWDGTTWNPDASKATRTGAVNGNGGHSLFYSDALHAWVNMYLEYPTNKVKYQVAGQPMGPFSASKLAFEVPKGNGTTYGLMVHTEYEKQAGAVQYASWYDSASGGQGLAKIQFTLPASTPTATSTATPAASSSATATSTATPAASSSATTTSTATNTATNTATTTTTATAAATATSSVTAVRIVAPRSRLVRTAAAQ
ncbi:MAG: hypothetical protein ACRYF3_10565 [Janthinobacterium lividum]